MYILYVKVLHIKILHKYYNNLFIRYLVTD